MIIDLKTTSFERSPRLSPDVKTVRRYLRNKKQYFILKRISDILISSVISFFLIGILLPIVAILIKIESRGPIFFVQRRVGLGGRSFLCYKFRTMVINSQANTEQAKKNDVRITRVGKFLRDCNIDEFPQFINVLMGDMSIVGPRPHMHSDCAKFSTAIPGYKIRNFVKPGITGLAQVKGYRGPTLDFTSMFHRYQFDAFYIRNAGFWMDMRIIRHTAGQTLNLLMKKFSDIVWTPSVYYRRWVTFFLVFLF